MTNGENKTYKHMNKDELIKKCVTLHSRNNTLEETIKRQSKILVMQEMEYNQLLKSYNRLAKELKEAKANRSPFSIFKK